MSAVYFSSGYEIFFGRVSPGISFIRPGFTRYEFFSSGFHPELTTFDHVVIMVGSLQDR